MHRLVYGVGVSYVPHFPPSLISRLLYSISFLEPLCRTRNVSFHYVEGAELLNGSHPLSWKLFRRRGKKPVPQEAGFISLSSNIFSINTLEFIQPSSQHPINICLSFIAQMPFRLPSYIKLTVHLHQKPSSNNPLKFFWIYFPKFRWSKCWSSSLCCSSFAGDRESAWKSPSKSGWNLFRKAYIFCASSSICFHTSIRVWIRSSIHSCRKISADPCGAAFTAVAAVCVPTAPAALSVVVSAAHPPPFHQWHGLAKTARHMVTDHLVVNDARADTVANSIASTT